MIQKNQKRIQKESKKSLSDLFQNSEENLNEMPENYLDIWKINPSYKDISLNSSLIKSFFLIFLILFLTFSTFIISLDKFIAFGIGIITLFLFLLAFHDSFFSLNKLLSFKTKRFVKVNPFEDLEFIYFNSDPKSLYFINKKELINVGLQIFEIKVIPENIHPTLNQFLKALGRLRIPFSYQIIQTPLLDISNKSENNVKKRHNNINSVKSYRISIYFSIYYYIKGIFNNSKITQLRNKLEMYSNSLKANFSANFHHFQISQLSGNDLINALRVIFFKESTHINYKNNDISISNEKVAIGLIKIFFFLFLLIYCSIILFLLNFSASFIILLNILISIGIFLIWWREFLFYFSKSYVKRDETAFFLNPFKDFSFYWFKNIPDSIFVYIDNQLLINTKIFNLKHVFSPQFCYPGKFFRSLIYQKSPFNYSILTAPISFRVFNEEGYKFLNEKTRLMLLKRNKTAYDCENWLNMRSGIWRTILIISISTYQFISHLTLKKFLDLEEDLKIKAETLKNSFQMNFMNYSIVQLKNRKLISGIQALAIKNKFFRINGTHLNYLLFQGKNLMNLTRIIDEFKKGIETKIAAEFNSPLSLENFITFGYTINTEFLEEEIPVGLTLDQLNNLLIVSGTQRDRLNFAMKIVIELVKTNTPSIIFDFNGKWSKIINFFRDSRYEKDFLYFKLGTAFNLNLMHSGIPYDKNNLEYLNFIFDVYALTFKKDDKTIEILKNTILRNPEMDLSTLALDFQNKQKWEKNPIAESMIAFFNDFSRQTISFFHTPELNSKKSIIEDFLKNNKTIIVDISILKDKKLQIFTTFILISKIIHYLSYSKEYYKKKLLIPNIDIFFDFQYLDKNINYWRINKFLDPLSQNGFGFIFSANQIRYLHSNIYNYFSNIISFKTTDTKDIAILKNQMNLQELHGTGYYSSKRNNTYQIDYLMSMKSGEILIKRADINQPFPAKINLDELKNSIPLKEEQIFEYMKEQGYDLKHAEKKILAQAKKTIFEKDLGEYSIFLEEIVRFLKALHTVHKIGNLYKSKLKKELLKFIYPKAVKLTKDKRKLIKIRDNLFEKLKKHDYLIENHPKTAGGSETIRTSYSVGSKYKKALDDFFQCKKNSLANISIEPIKEEIEKNPGVEDLFFKNDESNFSEDLEFKEALMKETGSYLLYNLFKMNTYINNNNYEKALHIGKNFIKLFLIKLYKKIFEYNTETNITNQDITSSIEYLAEQNKIPFNKEELIHFLKISESINLNSENIGAKLKEIYNMLSDFSLKIQKQIIEG